MSSGNGLFAPDRWDGMSWEWRNVICSPYCPLPPGHKHVLTTLALYGDKYGDNVFPSQRELAFRAGVSLKTVNHVMQRAEREGWLIRHERGGGRSYRRHVYELAIPAYLADAIYRYPKIWEPPYRLQLEEHDGDLILTERKRA